MYIGHTVWELEQLPADWLGDLHSVDALWVPHRVEQGHVRGRGIRRPIASVPHVITTDPIEEPPVEIPGGVTVFSTVASWHPRKRPDWTVEAYARAFRKGDPVLLIVKTDPWTDAWPATNELEQMTWWQVLKVLRRHEDPPEVMLVNDRFSDAEVNGLLARSNCFVSLACSEGWGLGVFDAATLGTPVVTTGYGGHLAYLGPTIPASCPRRWCRWARWRTRPTSSRGCCGASPTSTSPRRCCARLPTATVPAVAQAKALAAGYGDLLPGCSGAARRVAAGPADVTEPHLLVLTPVKDAANEAKGYVDRLLALEHPAAAFSLALLESDSTDGTYDAFDHELPRLLAAGWREARIWKRDFGFRIPDGVPRWEPSVQLERRTVLALSRNHLLFNALAPDVDWVLWLDADVVEYRADIVELLLAIGRDIVQPHCVRRWGGPPSTSTPGATTAGCTSPTCAPRASSSRSTQWVARCCWCAPTGTATGSSGPRSDTDSPTRSSAPTPPRSADRRSARSRPRASA